MLLKTSNEFFGEFGCYGQTVRGSYDTGRIRALEHPLAKCRPGGSDRVCFVAVLSPPRGVLISDVTHGLRRGLDSSAATRLLQMSAPTCILLSIVTVNTIAEIFFLYVLKEEITALI
jgi:hypothetical protein